MARVLWFKDIHKENLAQAGGKGANLGEMWNNNFPIPPGFVITAQTYKEFIEETDIKDKILSLLSGLDVEDTDKLQKAAEKVQELITSTEIPEEIKEEITDSYDVLGLKKKSGVTQIMEGKGEFVAVRSSATAEDLPSISEEEYVFVKINQKPFLGRMEELAAIIKPTDELLVPSMDNFEICWKPVSGLYQHKVEKSKLYKITTSTGKEITISPNHTLIVLDEETMQPRVIEMKELRKGEKVPTLKKIPAMGSFECIDFMDYLSPQEQMVEHLDKIMIKNNSTNWKIQHGLPRKIKITPLFAYFLGLYAAEGTIYGQGEVIITNSQERVINKARDFVVTLGINAKNKINKGSFRFYCKAFNKFLKENCSPPNEKIKGKGKTCRTKIVPPFIFSCSEKIIGEYLQGCFDGDGTVSSNTVSYTSTSKKLIQGISILFQLLGMEAYLIKKKTSFTLSLPVKEIKNFKEKISFSHPKKEARLAELIEKYETAEQHFV